MDKKIAIVSGSSQGIGKEVAVTLATHDYSVYINGRDETKVNNTCAEIEKKGGKAKPLVGDLTNDEVSQNLLDKVMKDEKRLDVLVSNLGSGASLSGWDIPLKEYQRVFDINFFSAVRLSTLAAKQMKAGGNIIFISSIAGCQSIGAPIAYQAAKTALLSYAKALSDLISQKGIRVNTVSPGNIFFENGTWDKKWKEDKSKWESYLKANVPLNRFGNPKEIADAVTFLIKNEFMTGQNIIVDGGQIRQII